MKINCLLSISNRQIVDSKKNDIEIVTLGYYSKKNGKYYIIYNEYQEDCAYESSTTSILRIENEKHLTLIKTGTVQSRLVLEQGKRHHCEYKTEFGCLTLGIYANNIEYDLKQSSGDIYIKYFMDINSTVTSINEISINIKENN